MAPGSVLLKRMPRAPFSIAAAVVFVLACTTESNVLTNGRGGDGTRYNVKLPAPPAIREDDGTTLETTPGSSDASAAPPTDNSLVAYCVGEINRYRATLGGTALPVWSEAASCTATQCQNDATSKQAHGSFGQCTELGQNECPGWGGWQGDPKTVIKDCLAAMWAEGPGGGHYENMRRTSWRMASCEVYVAPNGQVTAIQNFR